jgi:putative DNA primase/helicase
MSAPTLETARSYVARGWNPIPIPYRAKKPVDDRWHERRIDASNVEQYFNGVPQNIGVQMGPQSNCLTDVDLDCKEALAVAPFLLPTSAAMFGRQSKRCSHLLFYTDLPETFDRAAIQFKDPRQQAEADNTDDKVMLLELRIGGGGRAAQTVFPPSIHKDTGEPIEWERGCDGEPTRIDGAALLRAAKEAAAACLFARYWPRIGGRHDAALVLGGLLARAGMDTPRIKLFAKAVAVAADADVNHLTRCAEDAARGFADGRNVFGFPAAVETFGETVAKKCAEWLGYQQPFQTRASAAGSNPTVVTLKRASDIEVKPISWVWPGWLARGKMHIIGGQPGVGKTTLALLMAATVTTGGQWPDGTVAAKGNVVVWSGEDDPADTIVPRLAASGADRERVFIVENVIENGEKRAFDPARDIEPLRRAVEAAGDVVLLIVDPIVNAVAGDSHKNGETRRGLQPLVDLANSIGAALLGVTHFSKGTSGREPIERITGSFAFGALARVVMVAAENQVAEDGGGRCILARAKSNIGPNQGGFAYSLRTTPMSDRDDIVVSIAVWGERIEGTARDMLAVAEAEPDKDEGGALTEAKEFLIDLLADGPKPAKACKAAATEAALSWDTVKRAKAKLGIKSIKFKEGWRWELPASDTAIAGEDREQSECPF